jgi:quercetin dioxygenase-like cupin family protein
MIVNVEQGAANPSVGTLPRISDALGVGLPALVEPPQLKQVKVIRNGDQYVSEAHTPSTKELVQVQQGTITIEAADQSITLDAGDAITFPGDVAHSYASAGTRPARFCLAVFEPGVGSGSRSEVTDA